MIIEDREINTEKQDTKSRAFEKGSMTDRPLAGLTEGHREDADSESQRGNGEHVLLVLRIKIILREDYEHLYANKLNNLD